MRQFRLGVVLVVAVVLQVGVVRAQYWKPVAGPYVGGASHITFDSRGDVIASDVGTVTISTDAGMTWKQILSLNYPDVITTVFVSATDQLFVPGASGHVYTSTDYGAHWNTLQTPATTGISSVLVDDVTTYVSADSSIYSSTDGGSHWTRKVIASHAVVTQLGIIQSHPFAIVTVSAFDEVFYTTDQGQSWILSNYGSSSHIVGIAADKSGHVYVATDSSVGLPNAPRGRTIAFAIAPNDDIYLSVGPSVATAVMYRSTDRGISWRRFGPVGANGSSIGFNGSTTYLGTWADALWQTTSDGLSWTHASFGIPATIESVEMLPSGRLLAAAGPKGLRGSDDFGHTWRSLSALSFYAVYKLPNGDLASYDGAAYNYYISTDQGTSWAVYDYKGSASDAQFTIDATGAFYREVRGGRDTIFRSTDEGVDWSIVKATPGFAMKNGAWFIGGSPGYPVPSDSLYRSLDLGTTWQNITPPHSDTANYVPFGETTDGTLIALVSHTTYYPKATASFHQLIRSTDKGSSWQPSGLNIYADFTTQFDASHDTLFVTTDGVDSSLFRSTDNGHTWQLLTDGLPLGHVNNVAIGQAGILFAATSTGVYQHGVSSAVALGITRTDAFDVFPNPASNEFTIESDHAGRAELFDITGRVIASKPLANGRAHFSTAQLPAGCYLVRVAGEAGVRAARVIVSR